MSRFNSYVNTAANLIASYKGDTPFAIFLKNFFSANKKYGSRDRKQIAAICYTYFRIGLAGTTETIEQKILLGLFLCETNPSEMMERLMPEWNKIMDQPLNNKLRFLNNTIDIKDVFPFKEELSDGIDFHEFCISYLTQPDLFLRIRPKTRTGFLKKLEKMDLAYTIIDEDCLVLPNTSKVEDHFLADKEVVIQDYNSQKVFNFLKNITLSLNSLPGVWDCCAASGGKSILLFDLLNQKIDLTVSDIRPSIILNLHQRFNKAGLKSYKYFIADIETAGFQHPITESDIIVCDVPCTGSGTWGRTPEQLHFFNKADIDVFSNRQKKITTNVIPYLKKNGLLVYITCSVFKKENEDVVHFLKTSFNLEILQMEILKGYDKKADSMFVSILRKKEFT